MGFWEQQMKSTNYSAAASVYTDDAMLEIDGTIYEGLAEIEGFFTNLGGEAIKYEYNYDMCLFDTCTFKGQYDFGEGVNYDFEITLEDGKILEEIVKRPGT